MILVVLCIWHSVIGALIFYHSTTPISPSNTFVYVDRWVMIGMLVGYFLIHALMLIWLFFVPYKRRRQMEYLDRQYAAKKHIRLEKSRSRFGSTQDLHLSRSPFVTNELPQIHVDRIPRSKENTNIIADPALFIPIQDNHNLSTRKFEIREPGDDASDPDFDERTITPIETIQEDV